jgi:hypothetical protein
MDSLLAICLLLATMTGGTDSREELNTKVAYKLWKATQERDPSAYPLVHEVLLDMTEQHYEYLRDVRLNAFDYIAATGDSRVLPLLKEIAKLPSASDDSVEAILDAYAISGALKALVSFRSEDAASINRRHVFGHPLVQTAAIDNLKHLRVWEATSDVEEMFCSTPPVGGNHVRLAAAAEFLDASPETSGAICPCIDATRNAFKEKIDAPLEGEGTIIYEQLGKSMTALTARLGCPGKDKASGS